MDAEHSYQNPELLEAVERRAARYPLQYLIGEWAFYRQTYYVSPDCLIPRSDTEILVEEAVRALPRGARFVDLCTGSGCIAVSVLAERPDTEALAVEKFENTLALARKNAAKNGVEERFSPMLADVLEPLALPEGTVLDAILSNPPYIARDQLASLSPEVKAEPSAALDGGEDGLIFYRKILELHTKHLSSDGMILFEIGYDQAAAVLALGAEYGFTDGRVLRDFGGNNRVVIFKRSGV
jgi:release factor glutamine methyltransferase